MIESEWGFSCVTQRRLLDLTVLCSVYSWADRQRCACSGALIYTISVETGATLLLPMLPGGCFARLMSPSLCKQSWQVWSHACALPTKFDLYNSELMLCLCNVCDNHAYAFKPPVFKYCIGRDWLKDCNPPLFVSLPRSFLLLGSDVKGVQRKASPDFTYIIFRKWEME